MGRIAQIAGLVLLVAGVNLAAWGTPYYMLDWGGTFVMAGIAIASAGLSCVLLGTVLIRLAALREDISFLRAQAALVAHEAVSEPVPASVPDPLMAPGMANVPGPEPVRATGGKAPESPAPESPAAGGLAAGMAGIVAAGGLAVAAKSILASATPAEPDAEAEAAADRKVDAADAPVSVSQRPAELTQGDRAALDDLLAKLSLPTSPVAADELVEAEQEPTTEPTTEPLPEAPSRAESDKLYAQITDATKALRSEAMLPVAEEAVSADESSIETKSVEATMEQRIEDDFAELRAELAVKPSDADLAMDALSFDTEPLTEAPEPDGKRDDDASRADGPEDIRFEEEPLEVADPDEDAADEKTTDEKTTVPDTEIASEPAPREPVPPSSDEGVVAAYNVGDTSYAMFADGRIRVSAPEGQFVLGSMDELKSFMASRRSQV